jgi:hypothetical protein
MRAALLDALLLAGCSEVPGAAPSPTTAAATAAPATPTAATPTTTAPPTASHEANTVYTADDQKIARLIRAGADEAIPQLKLLNDMDPGKLEDLFLPLHVWLTGQKAGIEAYTPSSCTTAAVALFTEGIERYDDIRKRFLALRDWGAHGHSFPVAAPGQAVLPFEDALVELEAHSPA